MAKWVEYMTSEQVSPCLLYTSKEAEEITPDYPNLKELIANMFETMNRADGVGLAAPVSYTHLPFAVRTPLIPLVAVTIRIFVLAVHDGAYSF